MKKLLPLLLLAFLFSCSKDPDALPEETQTGANSFGAKIDGELWTPQRFSSAGTSRVLEAAYSGLKNLTITASNFSNSPTETEFELYIKNLTGPGTYPLNTATEYGPGAGASYGYFVKRKFYPLNEWITGANRTGTVTITRLDTTERIVSGTFFFDAKSIDSSAADIQVREGRFDLRFNQ